MTSDRLRSDDAPGLLMVIAFCLTRRPREEWERVLSNIDTVSELLASQSRQERVLRTMPEWSAFFRRQCELLAEMEVPDEQP